MTGETNLDFQRGIRAAEGLDTADAYECWHVTVNERNGLTADGKPVKNWKAYVKKWCETRAKRRNA